MKKLFLLLLMVFSLVMVGSVNAATVTLGWGQPDLVVGNTNFLGWKMWYGTVSGGPYTQFGSTVVWSGTVAAQYQGVGTLTAPAGQETMYYFVCDAWNKPGTSTPENSTYSNQVSFLVDLKPPTVPVVTTTIPPVVPVGNLTINGTKEANSSVWVNGTQKVAINSATTWTTTLAVVKGANSFAVTSKDAAPWLNESAALQLTFQGAEAPVTPTNLTVTIVP